VAEPPRYLPDLTFPPYAFIAPHRPHPIRDPAGHMHGRPERIEPPLDPRAWVRSPAYLEGVDLFNHGYYWEAHEAWEALWNAAARVGPTAEFLKGLIKLAAAGVKVRQGEPRGVRIHCERAIAHFEAVAAETGAREYAGFALDDLVAFARDGLSRADALRGNPKRVVEVVFDRPLLLQRPAGGAPHAQH
jgi:uncharacterized protein